jgi:hypothetical protein
MNERSWLAVFLSFALVTLQCKNTRHDIGSRCVTSLSCRLLCSRNVATHSIRAQMLPDDLCLMRSTRQGNCQHPSWTNASLYKSLPSASSRKATRRCLTSSTMRKLPRSPMQARLLP